MRWFGLMLSLVSVVEKSMALRLARRDLDAAENKGSAVKKRETSSHGRS